MRFLGTWIWAVLLLAGAVSCVRPSVEERFIPAAQAENGLYIFPVDFSDSLAAGYDLTLYTRSDAVRFSPSAPIPVGICWYAPDSMLVLRERVFLPVGGVRGWTGPYRSGVRPDPAGLWRLTLRPEPGAEPIRGIGLAVRRKTNGYGTR